MHAGIPGKNQRGSTRHRELYLRRREHHLTITIPLYSLTDASTTLLSLHLLFTDTSLAEGQLALQHWVTGKVGNKQQDC